MDYQDHVIQESEALLLFIDKQLDCMTYHDKSGIDETGRPVI